MKTPKRLQLVNPYSHPLTIRGMPREQRYAHADEIADFVAYLASPGASSPAQNLAVDGGYAA